MSNKYELNINYLKSDDEKRKRPESAKERFEAAAPVEQPSEKEPKSQFKTVTGTVVAGAAALAISNAGLVSGSQTLQNKVNNASRGIGMAVGLAVNPAMTIAVLALSMANNAIKIANENRQWAIAEVRNSERLGIQATQRGRA